MKPSLDGLVSPRGAADTVGVQGSTSVLDGRHHESGLQPSEVSYWFGLPPPHLAAGVECARGCAWSYHVGGSIGLVSASCRVAAAGSGRDGAERH